MLWSHRTSYFGLNWTQREVSIVQCDRSGPWASSAVTWPLSKGSRYIITCKVLHMWAWHNNHRWDIPSVTGSIWWGAQDKSSLRKTILQSQVTAGHNSMRILSHTLMMLAESPLIKMRRIQSYLNNIQKMYESHPHQGRQSVRVGIERCL